MIILMLMNMVIMVMTIGNHEKTGDDDGDDVVDDDIEE